MGIRINKVLGYGIHLTPEEYETLLNVEAVKALGRRTGEEYIEFLKAKYAAVSHDELDYYLNDLHSGADLSTLSKRRASNFVTLHDTAEETVHDSVWLVITPPLVCDEWKHHDDPIDYYENAYAHRDEDGASLAADMKFFTQGLFPYDGTFINHATGERLHSEEVLRLRTFLRFKQNDPKPEDDKLVRLLLAGMKLTSLEEFRELVHPAPPVSVIDIAEWTGIFEDAGTARRLKPSLLTFWR